MDIHPQLNEIDDCLYRVATKALITLNNKVLLVQEVPEMWWGFPGGGVDHGETVESSLCREIEEEIGVPANRVTSDFEIAHYTIGSVINGVPRMNLFFKVSIAKEDVQTTDEVAESRWFDHNEFMNVDMSPSYPNREALAKVIFGS